MTPATTPASVSGFPHAGNLRCVRLSRLRPAEVNGSIYRPVDRHDPEVKRLANSIAEVGLIHPIVVTTDNVILSGHRRHCAAMLAGQATAMVQVIDIASTDERFVRMLVEANTAREKTLDEVLRETVVLQATPEDAHAELLESRKCRAERAAGGASCLIEIGEAKRRSKISAGRMPFLTAVIDVIEANRRYWPMSVRSIHYGLLNNPPLTWTKSGRGKRSNERYRNDKPSYDKLVDLLTQARFEGYVPFQAIHDPTRPVTEWAVSRTAGDYIRSSVGDFLQDYARDLVQSQPLHIEVVCEKNTLASVLRPVCGEYTVPLTIGRGYCSVPPRKQMHDRFVASGKDGMVIVVLSDHDPDGETIAESLVRSLRDDFAIDEDRITPVRAALSHDQVAALKLPPNSERAKQTSSNYAAFVNRYGEEVYELEAVAPAVLQRMLREAIEGVLDRDAFDAEVLREAADSAEIAAARARVMKAMGND